MDLDLWIASRLHCTGKVEYWVSPAAYVAHLAPGVIDLVSELTDGVVVTCRICKEPTKCPYSPAYFGYFAVKFKALIDLF